MESLIIEGTTKTPSVHLIPNDDIFEISGRSLPENVIKTYGPVLDWIDSNLGEIKNRPVKFVFKMDYLNSASAKIISVILDKFVNFYQAGIQVSVEWHYYADDDDIQSEGEIYAMLKKVPIKLVAMKE